MRYYKNNVSVLKIQKYLRRHFFVPLAELGRQLGEERSPSWVQVGSVLQGLLLKFSPSCCSLCYLRGERNSVLAAGSWSASLARVKGGPETEKHRHCQLTGRHWTRYGNIREHRVNANSQGREGGREGGGRRCRNMKSFRWTEDWLQARVQTTDVQQTACSVVRESHHTPDNHERVRCRALCSTDNQGFHSRSRSVSRASSSSTDYESESVSPTFETLTHQFYPARKPYRWEQSINTN